MEKYDLPNRSISPKQILEVVEGTSKRSMSPKEIIEYVSLDPSTIRLAIRAALALGMIEENGSNLIATDDCKKIFNYASNEQRILIFRKYLQRYDPLIQFLSFIDLGNEPSRAGGKVKTLYSMNVDPDELAQNLISWANYTDIIKYNKHTGEIKLSIQIDRLPSQYIKGLKEALENDIKSRIFISQKLTDDVFSFLDHPQIEELVVAICNFEKDPRNSVEDAGQACEDFLRKCCVQLGLTEVNTKRGMGELIEYLHQNKKISPKQYQIGLGINFVRIMAAHLTQAKSGKIWTITPDASIETILGIMTYMRSVYDFAFKGLRSY